MKAKSTRTLGEGRWNVDEEEEEEEEEKRNFLGWPYRTEYFQPDFPENPLI